MSLVQHIASQFRQPQGYLGQLAGVVMASRASNIERNHWTLDLLQLQPDDRVLEVGFGPGIAIERASQIVVNGKIVGIDHSQTMLHQAKRRNFEAIERGQVELHLGSVELLPLLGLAFNKVYTSNVVQFLDNAEKCFAYLYDALLPGGRIATTYMPRHPGATRIDAHKKATDIEQSLGAVGFRAIQTRVNPLKPVPAICVVATK